jgi:hypothetical protein
MRNGVIKLALGFGLWAALTTIAPAAERQNPTTGSWIMDSYVNTILGEAPTYKFGKSPTGQLILAPDGHFAMTFMEPPPADAAAWDNYLFAFGTYAIDRAKGQVVFHFRGSNNRKLIGAESARVFQVEGDRLTISYEDLDNGRPVKAVRTFHRAEPQDP